MDFDRLEQIITNKGKKRLSEREKEEINRRINDLFDGNYSVNGVEDDENRSEMP